MTAYRFAVTCPRCGNPPHHVTTGTGGTTTTAIVTCHTCHTDWQITAHIRPITQPNNLPPGGGHTPAQCGTESGHTAHRRRGELPCLACMEAVRAAKRARRLRSRTPQVVC